MDFVTISIIIAVSMLGVAFLAITGVIAGKDVLFAFRRFFQKKGCDIYIANDARNIEHYYKVPEGNCFKINDETYITNPKKVMNLDDEAITKSVNDSIKNLNESVKKRVVLIEKKIEALKEKLLKVEDEKQIAYIKSEIERLDQIKVQFENKLKIQEQNYYKDKRPAFFYIKGDPIPKDFYEFYSELDSKIIDNIVSRAISKPPTQKTENELDKLKKWIIGAAIAAAIAAVLTIGHHNILMEICRAQGLACALF